LLLSCAILRLGPNARNLIFDWGSLPQPAGEAHNIFPVLITWILGF